MTDGSGDSRRLRLSDFLPYQLAVLADGASRLLADAYAEQAKLTIPEWRVLAMISELDPAAARDVVARTPMDKMTVSRAVVSLESKGLISRAPSETDRRSSLLRLTSDGAVRFARVAELALEQETRMLAVLTEAEKETLSKLVLKLSAHVERLREED